jgi:hypothetical protein
MNTLSKIISILFHPLLIPTYIILLFIQLNSVYFTALNPKIALGIVFINTFFFPALAMLLMKKLEFIDSLEMPDKQQRIIPLIVTMVCYIWAYLSVKKTGFPTPFSWFILGAVISLALAFVVNVFHKLSLHMVAISGALMAVMMMFFYAQQNVQYYFLFAILVVGMVASARLYLNAHTAKEINTGFIVGLAGQSLAAFFIN